MTAVEQHFTAVGAGLQWRGHGETILVEPWGRDSVRVRARLMEEILDHDWALLPPSGAGAAHVAIAGDTATLVNGALTVVATSRTGIPLQTGYDRNFCHLAFSTPTDAVGNKTHVMRGRIGR